MYLRKFATSLLSGSLALGILISAVPAAQAQPWRGPGGPGGPGWHRGPPPGRGWHGGGRGGGAGLAVGSGIAGLAV
ncbi:MAG: hypothetical protein ABF590_11015, partial [Komagataeibacter saccharivorans]